jgi:hypothetical protein
MADPRPTNAEMAQLLAMAEEAGLVEVFVDDDGREAYQITDDGFRVGHIPPMGGESDADAVLEALLGAGGADTPDR